MMHLCCWLASCIDSADAAAAAAARLGLQDFNTWLLDACVKPPRQRQQQLSGWAAAPGARAAHPREEHLIPLMVVAGAAASSSSGSSAEELGVHSAGHVLWDGECMGAAVSAVGFGHLVDEQD
jgi:aromatic ring-opening dioxygenase catalytic subunit (LigB family)